MNINVELLREKINRLKVTVPFNGFVGFEHDVIPADKLFDSLHECCDGTKEELIEYVNSGKYKENEFLYDIFHNIKSQGHFMIKGYEPVGCKNYIECKSLKWL